MNLQMVVDTETYISYNIHAVLHTHNVTACREVATTTISPFPSFVKSALAIFTAVFAETHTSWVVVEAEARLLGSVGLPTEPALELSDKSRDDAEQPSFKPSLFRNQYL